MGTAAATTSTTNKKIAGVLFAKVDEKPVDRALKKLDMPSTGKLDFKVKRLAAFFAAAEKDGKDLFICDNCKGPSTDDWTFCPFCGIEGSVAVDNPDEAKAKAKATNGAKDKAAPALKGKDVGAKAKPAVAQIVVKDKKTGKLLTASDLDASVVEIQSLKTKFALNAYELGVALKDNHDRELWKLRIKDDGAPKYTNIKQFWKEEVGITHPWAYKLMETAAAFSEADLAQVGASKAHLILRAPEKHRAKLLAQAKKGATRDDLEDAVKKLTGGSRTSSPRGDRITLALSPGRKTLKMYARPKKRGDDPKRAKRVADDAWTEWELDNDVKIRFVLQKDANDDLVLVTEVKRV